MGHRTAQTKIAAAPLLLVFLLGSLGAVACSAKSETPAATNPPLDSGQCRSEVDCEGNQVCQAAEAIEPGLRALMVAPCPIQMCSTDEQCAGQLCQSGPSMPQAFPNCFNFGGGHCGPACTATSCSPGYSCASDGHCVLLPCTDPEFIGCPEGTYCDETVTTLLDPTQASAATLSTEGTNAFFPTLEFLQAGCKQLRCDEVGGPMCNPGWSCESTTAPTTSVGCVALSCQEFGACSDDNLYVCEPTSSNPRYDGVDPHGCVRKNCEEGDGVCTQYQVCDFTRPDIDQSGCSFRSCDEPMGSCPTAGDVCDPGHQYSNVYGCRMPNCNEGQTCQPGATCNPASDQADARGCVAPTLVGQGGATSQPPDPPADDPKAPLGGPCQADEHCQQGYCVEQICRAAPGRCQTQ